MKCFLRQIRVGRCFMLTDNVFNLCRSPGGSYLGDVNISAILDSFSVSYDKRVRPNYGGKLFFLWVLCSLEPELTASSTLSKFFSSKRFVVFKYSVYAKDRAIGGSRAGRDGRVGLADRCLGGLLSDAQHLSRPPLWSQPLSGRKRRDGGAKLTKIVLEGIKNF